ncbi:MAG TPA: hypothetical protein VK492_20505 [Chitinophagaceae bacterium]|nr:hypothetical protein [Chitinophagaceae bacterium]
MEQNQSDVLTESLLQLKNKRRKDLLPWWVKVFIWIFLIFGAIAPLGLILGILGYKFEVSLYGFETNEPISIIGISIILIFLFKGFTAYSLLKEKNWAIILGIMDAIIGIAICSFAMLYPLFNSDAGVSLTFRLELVLLIPYLLKMIKIKSEWQKSILF